MGADEYIDRLEGKIRKCLFFYVKVFYNNSVKGGGFFCAKEQELKKLTLNCSRVVYFLDSRTPLAQRAKNV